MVYLVWYDDLIFRKFIRFPDFFKIFRILNFFQIFSVFTTFLHRRFGVLVKCDDYFILLKIWLPYFSLFFPDFSRFLKKIFNIFRNQHLLQYFLTNICCTFHRRYPDFFCSFVNFDQNFRLHIYKYSNFFCINTFFRLFGWFIFLYFPIFKIIDSFSIWIQSLLSSRSRT